MLKKILTIALLLAGSLAASAQSWRPVGSEFSFTVRMMGVSVSGTFSGFEADALRFDPAQPGASSFSGSVAAATVNTGNTLRDRHLREKEDFFQAARYPRISLKSTRIEKSAAGYVGTFELTIRNVTRSVRIPFRFTPSGASATLMGTAVIDRRDWKLGGNTWGMADDVTLNLKIELTR